MPYITKANAKRIIKRINLSDIEFVDGVVYKKPIYFLSSWEAKYLLLMKTLLKEPERFSIEVYNPIINKDTFRYVFESKQPPSYHMDKNCEKLNSDFKNFEIPFEIKARATEKAKREKLSEEETHKLVENKVNTFRHWFMLNFKLFKEDTNAFLRKLEVQWNIRRKISEMRE